MRGPGNSEVHLGVIYDWRLWREWFVEKVSFESVVKEIRGDKLIDAESGDADENDDLTWQGSETVRQRLKDADEARGMV